MSRSLRDHILSFLHALPNAHELHLVALSSTPKRNTSLFPHTPSSPRCFQIDYFVVLGTDVDPASTPPSKNAEEAQVEEKTDMSSEKGGRMVLTSAIFATLYILPNHGRSILYISKVDSSSYTALSTSSPIPISTPNPPPTAPPRPSPANLPLTRTLITAFISYFLLPQYRPTPSARVQLFARSQGQYLFPNSASGKKGLGGGKLCGWWKGVYEDVVRAIVSTSSENDKTKAGLQITIQQGAEGTPLIRPSPDQKVSPEDIHLSYLLPSYSALEAKGMMGLPRVPLPRGIEWTYEPPFAYPIPGIGLSASGTAGKMSLADCIPSLEDDPKTRFLDELATDTSTRKGSEATGVAINGAEEGTHQGEAGAVRSSQTPSQAVSTSNSLTTSQLGPSSPSTPTPQATTPDHLQPSITPTNPISQSQPPSTNSKKPSHRHTPKALSAAEDEKYRKQAHSILSQTTPGEFWERMGYRGECALDVTGFFTLRVSPRSPSRFSTTGDSEVQTISVPPTPPSHIDPTPQKGQLSPAIVHRIHESLLNTDFATFALALEGSADWMESMRRIVTGEIGEEGLGLCVGEVKAKEGKELEVMGGKRERAAETITVLQPRKKKKV